MAAPLPPRVLAEVQRIADASARRMLDEHLSGKADHSNGFTDKREAKRLYGSCPDKDKEGS